MDQMCAAIGANALRALHKQRIVGAVGHGVSRHRFPKTGLARAAVKFGTAFEQRRIAAHTMICAVGFAVPIRAGKSALRAGLPRDIELLIAELLAPFGLAALQRPYRIVFFPAHEKPIRTIGSGFPKP